MCFTSKDKHQMGIGFMFCAHNLTNITDLRNVTRTAKIYKAVFSLLASNAKKWVTLLLGVGEGVTWVNYKQWKSSLIVYRTHKSVNRKWHALLNFIQKHELLPSLNYITQLQILLVSFLGSGMIKFYTQLAVMIYTDIGRAILKSHSKIKPVTFYEELLDKLSNTYI